MPDLMHMTSNSSDQSIEVPLPVGSRVVLYEEVDIDEEEGAMIDLMFSDYVAQYVPSTGLLRFEESDVGRAEFQRLVQEADGVEIITNY